MTQQENDVFGEFVKTHNIGEYTIVEYHPYIVEGNVYTSDVNYDKKLYEVAGTGYHYTSLDCAIIGAICHKYECRDLAHPIARMIGMVMSKQENFKTPSLQESYDRVQIAIAEIEGIAGSNGGVLPVSLSSIYDALLDRQILLANQLEKKENYEFRGKIPTATLDDLLRKSLVIAGLVEK